MQWTTWLLILVIGIAGYFIWALLPAYEDNYTARQAIESIANQAWRRAGKEELHRQAMDQMARIGSHVETPAGGVPVRVPGLPVDDENVVITCTDTTSDCSSYEGDVVITVTYTRVMDLPYLTGKTVSLHFAPTVKESLAPVNWN